MHNVEAHTVSRSDKRTYTHPRTCAVTHIQAQMHTYGHTRSHRNMYTHIYIETYMHSQTLRLTRANIDTWTDRHASIKTDEHSYIHTDWQTDRQTNIRSERFEEYSTRAVNTLCDMNVL